MKLINNALAFAAVLAVMVVPAFAASPSESDTLAAKQWVSAKFLDKEIPAEKKIPSIYVIEGGSIQIDGRNGKKLQVDSRQFDRGIYCEAPSKLLIKLPSAGAKFEASVGPDNNYDTMPDRTSLSFVVSVRDEEKYRSAVLNRLSGIQNAEVNLSGAVPALAVPG